MRTIISIQAFILIVLVSIPSSAAIVRVVSPGSAVCNKPANDTLPLSCSATTPPVVGNTLIIAAFNGGFLAITDNASPPNIYTMRVLGNLVSGAQISLWSAPINNTTSGTFTYTVSVTSGNAYITTWVAGEYSGLGASPAIPAIDVTTSALNSSGGVGHCSVTPNFVTTINAADLVIGVTGYNSPTLTTSTAGFTMHSLSGAGSFFGTNPQFGSLDNITISTLTALDVTVTGSAGQVFAGCALAAFKAGGVLPVVIPRHRIINQ